MEITFTVLSEPAPGGSKKGFYIKSIGRVVETPACKRTKPWMATVAAYAKEAYSGELLEGALKLTLRFFLVKPKSSKRKYPTVRPDLTKLIRSTEDALKGIIWHDDSQVVIQDTRKAYVARDPGVQVIINTLE